VERISGQGCVPPVATDAVRVAQYIRKSTDHQKYSTENQSASIHEYAARRAMQIVRTYADEGISGVTFRKRESLQQLIDDVVSRKADFSAILVYDVSRWSRAQDVDEAAYYEYLCKRAGINVHYCAEPFENDGSALATLFKNLKRMMAGEYSRELSVKVFAGQARLFKCGFRQGGMTAYGMRRLLVDQAGVPKAVLAPGQCKSIQTDRVVAILGPPKERRIVRWIFSAFVIERKSEGTIAETLNKKGALNSLGGPWTYRRVHHVLKDEIYTGTSVWNRTSIKLGGRLVHNDPETWLRVKCGFKPVVDPMLFEQAQAIIRGRMRRRSDEEVLAPLRRLWRKHGYLSARLIDSSAGIPCASTLARRFGSLGGVYRLLGYETTYGRSDDELLAMLKALLKKQRRLSYNVIDQAVGLPHASAYGKRFGSLSRAYELIGYQPRRNTFQATHLATRKLSNVERLELLRRLLTKKRHLSARIIRASKGVPSVPAYTRRFGSLLRAYELIGYTQKRRVRSGTRRRMSRKSTASAMRSTVRRKKRHNC
jgi:DNA invertase Pin-like site-specific DNA recombinase